MHVWIQPILLQQLDETFVEGQTYEICNFTVAPFTQKYKCLPSVLQIFLRKDTVVRTLESNNFRFAEKVFSFTDLEDVKKRYRTDENLIGKYKLT